MDQTREDEDMLVVPLPRYPHDKDKEPWSVLPRNVNL